MRPDIILRQQLIVWGTFIIMYESIRIYTSLEDLHMQHPLHHIASFKLFCSITPPP